MAFSGSTHKLAAQATKSIRQDQDRILLPASASSSTRTQCSSGLAWAIALFDGIGFSISVDPCERPQTSEPQGVLEKSIRPALSKLGSSGKQIGWHSFRHSLATNLRSLGVDIKVAQELMRHSSCRTTLDVYTCAVDQRKREASLKVMDLMLPMELRRVQHLPHPCRVL